jgi:Protein of unknown function (DUF3168)
MPSFSALAPASAGIYTALNVAALTALVPGGVADVFIPGTAFPCVLFEVSDNKQWGGMGTQPGRGQLPELDVRVHVFTQDQNLSNAQQIIAKCIELLATPPAVALYGSWAIFHDQTLDMGDQVVANVTVHEIVAIFRLYCEQQG